VTTSASPIIHPLLVKPGDFGRRVITFVPAEADWYEVEVTVAGREFHFRFDSAGPESQEKPKAAGETAPAEAP